MNSINARVPASAAWLGGLGVIPFVALAATLAFLDQDRQAIAVHALVAYGASILSFLGGVHWGLGIAGRRGAPGTGLAGRLALSVVPSLVAWVALLVTPFAGLMVLAGGIALMLGVDLLTTRSGLAPAWYPRLRIPLSCAVATTLLAAGLLVR